MSIQNVFPPFAEPASRELFLGWLVESFNENNETMECPSSSRLEYLADYVFNIITYDKEMAEIFAHRAVEVCYAISEHKTFDYIKDPARHVWYLAMVNMPFFAEKINWGTSIRGAFWDTPIRGKIKLSTFGMWKDGNQIHDAEFTREEWEMFAGAIVDFAGPEMNKLDVDQPA
jgi:hypothetical protein